MIAINVIFSDSESLIKYRAIELSNFYMHGMHIWILNFELYRIDTVFLLFPGFNEM